MSHYIYGLVDPRDSEVIRYVGYTKDLFNRFKQHVHEARKGIRTHRCNWIRSLLSAGTKPAYVVLEEVIESTWQEREKFWIKVYRATLTNTTEGGEGLINPSQEVRDKIAEKCRVTSTGNTHRRGKPASEETKRRISEGMRNSERFKLSVKQKFGMAPIHATEAARLVVTGRKKTDLHKSRISESMKNSESVKAGAEKRVGLKLASASEKKKGRRWINNGIEAKQLLAGESLPEGWKFGMKLK